MAADDILYGELEGKNLPGNIDDRWRQMIQLNSWVLGIDADTLFSDHYGWSGNNAWSAQAALPESWLLDRDGKQIPANSNPAEREGYWVNQFIGMNKLNTRKKLTAEYERAWPCQLSISSQGLERTLNPALRITIDVDKDASPHRSSFNSRPAAATLHVAAAHVLAVEKMLEAEGRLGEWRYNSDYTLLLHFYEHKIVGTVTLLPA